MNDIIGVAWFNDELTYRRALDIFTDSKNMPATFKGWKTLVERQLEEITRVGNIAIRVDMEPETFTDWCIARGLQPNAQGRVAFVNHAILEHERTGKGTIIE